MLTRIKICTWNHSNNIERGRQLWYHACIKFSHTYRRRSSILKPYIVVGVSAGINTNSLPLIVWLCKGFPVRHHSDFLQPTSKSGSLILATADWSLTLTLHTHLLVRTVYNTRARAYRQLFKKIFLILLLHEKLSKLTFMKNYKHVTYVRVHT